ncbi:hypothetical protein [Enterobacter ludwigii]|uniref:hypothetical protein n=1 Tax=Enterobacter ludwigii TaxID=299767 RepID=UPI0039757BD4
MNDEQHANELAFEINSASKLNSNICARILMLAELKNGSEARSGTVTTGHPELTELLGSYHEIKKYFAWLAAKGMISIIDEQAEHTMTPVLHIILTGKGLREARHLKELSEYA